MNFEQLNKKIESILWYKQAAAAKPLGFSYPLATYFEQSTDNKAIPISNNNMITVAGHNYLSLWHDSNSLQATADYYVAQQKIDPSFVRRLKSQWDFKADKLRKLIRREEQESMTGCTDRELFDLFHKFSSDLTDLWRESIFHDSFDWAGEDILKKEATAMNQDLSSDDLALFGALVGYSWSQRELRDLLNIHDSITGDKPLKDLLNLTNVEAAIKNKYPDLFKKITAHTAKYHWLYYDYEVIKALTVKDFLVRLEMFDDKEYKKITKQKLTEVVGVKSSKDRMVVQRNLGKEFQNVVELLEVVAQWRDDRKAMNQMSNGLVYKFLQEFAKRSNYSIEEIEQLYWWEIIGIIDPSQKVHLEQLMTDRFSTYVCYERLRDGVSFFGEEAKQLESLLEKQLDDKTLKGHPAYRGIVRGIVKIVRNQGEFQKMNKDDILVTPSTRPEYVPIMKLAAAIISEEGGLTCHAAIVSRELKIPAIVGVQGVMKALKDGDMVEVDAEKGVVKKI